MSTDRIYYCTELQLVHTRVATHAGSVLTLLPSRAKWLWRKLAIHFEPSTHGVVADVLNTRWHGLAREPVLLSAPLGEALGM